jgi:hypothetical protein
MHLKLSHLAAATSVAALVLASAPASATNPGTETPKPDKAACVAALDTAQTLQTARKLKEARASFLQCTNEACPGIVREDCAKALLDVEKAMPSVVLSAHVDGHDATDAKVYLDGERQILDGHAIPVDPGQHVARFERQGSAPIEVKVVAREGEKNRLVDGTFVMPRMNAKPVKTEGSRTPIVPIVLAGTGALALGGAVLFRMQADSDADRLRTTCAPACDAGERDALSNKLVMSNVALAVGLGALAVSAITWVFDPSR